MKTVHSKVEIAALAWVGERNIEVEQVTPLDTEELRDSAYVMVDRRPRRTVIEIGFKAEHAPFVHEWPSTVNWTTPGTGSKFLERPYFTKAPTLLGFIKAKARI